MRWAPVVAMRCKCNRALRPYAPDEQIQIRMQRGLPTAESDDAGPERAEFVNALQHLGSGNRLRVFVEFITVRARQVAAPSRYYLSQIRMVRGRHGPRKHPRLTPAPLEFQKCFHIRREDSDGSLLLTLREVEGPVGHVIGPKKQSDRF